MSDSTMRPRKGDLFVHLNDGDTSVRMLLGQEYVTPEHREIIAKMMELTAQFVEVARAKPAPKNRMPASADPRNQRIVNDWPPAAVEEGGTNG